MKLLYIYTSASYSQNSSVQQKLKEQISALNANGADTSGCFIAHDVDEEICDGKIRYLPLTQTNPGWFQSIRRRGLAMRQLLKVLQTEGDPYDAIWLRYPGASWSLLKFARIYGHKTFVNHLAAEIPEILLYQPSAASESFVSRFLGNLEFKWLPVLYENIYGRWFRRLVRFAVCNSTDIAAYQKKMSFGKYRSYLICDGVDVKSIPMQQGGLNHGDISAVFLKGASSPALYNGLDRVMLGIKNYSGNTKIALTVIGNSLDYELGVAKSLGIEDKVVLKPFMDSVALNEEMRKHNMGIASFGLHRKGLRSNSTIKSREYFARGIPFIYGHTDPDFSENAEAARYCMEFPADDSAVDFEAVVAFMEPHLRDPAGTATAMRAFAEKQLDYAMKMKQLVQVLETEFPGN